MPQKMFNAKTQMAPSVKQVVSLKKFAYFTCCMMMVFDMNDVH